MKEKEKNIYGIHQCTLTRRRKVRGKKRRKTKTKQRRRKREKRKTKNELTNVHKAIHSSLLQGEKKEK
jgi:hypothetical protein